MSEKDAPRPGGEIIVYQAAEAPSADHTTDLTTRGTGRFNDAVVQSLVRTLEVIMPQILIKSRIEAGPRQRGSVC